MARDLLRKGRAHNSGRSRDACGDATLCACGRRGERTGNRCDRDEGSKCLLHSRPSCACMASGTRRATPPNTPSVSPPFVELFEIDLDACVSFRDFANPSGGIRETAQTECHGRAAVVIKPVSADSLDKMGIFANEAGDFRRFPPQVRQSGSPETKANVRKAGISGPFLRHFGSLAKRGNGWLGREGSNLRMAESKSAALPLGYAPTGSFAENGGKSLCPSQSVPAPPVYRERCGISTRLRQPPSSEGGLRRVKRLRRAQQARP
jgi:hypothetical protein